MSSGICILCGENNGQSIDIFKRDAKEANVFCKLVFISHGVEIKENFSHICKICCEIVIKTGQRCLKAFESDINKKGNVSVANQDLRKLKKYHKSIKKAIQKNGTLNFPPLELTSETLEGDLREVLGKFEAFLQEDVSEVIEIDSDVEYVKEEEKAYDDESDYTDFEFDMSCLNDEDVNKNNPNNVDKIGINGNEKNENRSGVFTEDAILEIEDSDDEVIVVDPPRQSNEPFEIPPCYNDVSSFNRHFNFDKKKVLIGNTVLTYIADEEEPSTGKANRNKSIGNPHLTSTVSKTVSPNKRKLETSNEVISLSPSTSTVLDLTITDQVTSRTLPANPNQNIKVISNHVIKTIEIPNKILNETPKVTPNKITEAIPNRITKAILNEITKENLNDITKVNTKENPSEITDKVPNEITEAILNEIVTPNETTRVIPNEITGEITKEVLNEIPKVTSNKITEAVSNKITKAIPNEITQAILNEIVTPNETTRIIPNEIAKENPNEIIKDSPNRHAKSILIKSPVVSLARISPTKPNNLLHVNSPSSMTIEEPSSSIDLLEKSKQNILDFENKKLDHRNTLNFELKDDLCVNVPGREVNKTSNSNVASSAVLRSSRSRGKKRFSTGKTNEDGSKKTRDLFDSLGSGENIVLNKEAFVGSLNLVPVSRDLNFDETASENAGELNEREITESSSKESVLEKSKRQVTNIQETLQKESVKLRGRSFVRTSSLDKTKARANRKLDSSMESLNFLTPQNKKSKTLHMCTICGTFAENRRSLNIHEKMHLRCKLCKLTFKNMGEVKAHSVGYHNKYFGVLLTKIDKDFDVVTTYPDVFEEYFTKNKLWNPLAKEQFIIDTHNTVEGVLNYEEENLQDPAPDTETENYTCNNELNSTVLNPVISLTNSNGEKVIYKEIVKSENADLNKVVGQLDNKLSKEIQTEKPNNSNIIYTSSNLIVLENFRYELDKYKIPVQFRFNDRIVAYMEPIVNEPKEKQMFSWESLPVNDIKDTDVLEPYVSKKSLRKNLPMKTKCRLLKNKAVHCKSNSSVICASPSISIADVGSSLELNTNTDRSCNFQGSNVNISSNINSRFDVASESNDGDSRFNISVHRNGKSKSNTINFNLDFNLHGLESDLEPNVINAESNVDIESNNVELESSLMDLESHFSDIIGWKSKVASTASPVHLLKETDSYLNDQNSTSKRPQDLNKPSTSKAPPSLQVFSKSGTSKIKDSKFSLIYSISIPESLISKQLSGYKSSSLNVPLDLPSLSDSNNILLSCKSLGFDTAQTSNAPSGLSASSSLNAPSDVNVMSDLNPTLGFKAPLGFGASSGLSASLSLNALSDFNNVTSDLNSSSGFKAPSGINPLSAVSTATSSKIFLGVKASSVFKAPLSCNVSGFNADSICGRSGIKAPSDIPSTLGLCPSTSRSESVNCNLKLNTGAEECPVLGNSPSHKSKMKQRHSDAPEVVDFVDLSADENFKPIDDEEAKKIARGKSVLKSSFGSYEENSTLSSFGSENSTSGGNKAKQSVAEDSQSNDLIPEGSGSKHSALKSLPSGRIVSLFSRPAAELTVDDSTSKNSASDKSVSLNLESDKSVTDGSASKNFVSDGFAPKNSMYENCALRPSDGSDPRNLTFDSSAPKNSLAENSASKNIKSNSSVAKNSASDGFASKHLKFDCSDPKNSVPESSAPKNSKSDVSTLKNSKSDVSTLKNSKSDISTLKNSKSDISTLKNSKSDVSTLKNSKSDVSTLKNSKFNVSILKNSKSDISTLKNSKCDGPASKSLEFDSSAPKNLKFDSSPTKQSTFENFASKNSKLVNSAPKDAKFGNFAPKILKFDSSTPKKLKSDSCAPKNSTVINFAQKNLKPVDFAGKGLTPENSTPKNLKFDSSTRKNPAFGNSAVKILNFDGSVTKYSARENFAPKSSPSTRKRDVSTVKNSKPDFSASGGLKVDGSAQKNATDVISSPTNPKSVVSAWKNPTFENWTSRNLRSAGTSTAPKTSEFDVLSSTSLKVDGSAPKKLKADGVSSPTALNFYRSAPKHLKFGSFALENLIENPVPDSSDPNNFAPKRTVAGKSGSGSKNGTCKGVKTTIYSDAGQDVAGSSWKSSSVSDRPGTAVVKLSKLQEIMSRKLGTTKRSSSDSAAEPRTTRTESVDQDYSIKNLYDLKDSPSEGSKPKSNVLILCYNSDDSVSKKSPAEGDKPKSSPRSKETEFKILRTGTAASESSSKGKESAEEEEKPRGGSRKSHRKRRRRRLYCAAKFGARDRKQRAAAAAAVAAMAVESDEGELFVLDVPKVWRGCYGGESKAAKSFGEPESYSNGRKQKEIFDEAESNESKGGKPSVAKRFESERLLVNVRSNNKRKRNVDEAERKESSHTCTSLSRSGPYVRSKRRREECREAESKESKVAVSRAPNYRMVRSKKRRREESSEMRYNTRSNERKLRVFSGRAGSRHMAELDKLKSGRSCNGRQSSRRNGFSGRAEPNQPNQREEDEKQNASEICYESSSLEVTESPAETSNPLRIPDVDLIKDDREPGRKLVTVLKKLKFLDSTSPVETNEPKPNSKSPGDDPESASSARAVSTPLTFPEVTFADDASSKVPPRATRVADGNGGASG